MRISSKKLLLVSLVATFVAAQAVAQQIKPDETKRIELNQAYGKLPLNFEANQGQTDPQVKFLSRGNGYSLFLTPTEAVIVLKKTAQDNDARPGVLPSQVINDHHKTSQSFSPATVLRMKLVGSNATVKIAGRGELPGKVNYFTGNDPAKWRTGVPTYAKVRYEQVYSGIDLVYYGNQRQLEYDFIVSPGADPGDIRLSFAGAEKMRVDTQGALVVQTAGRAVRWNKPIVYQEMDGNRRSIDGKFVLRHGHQVSFQVAAYNASKPLVIDPKLVYSTYLGGSGYEPGVGIAVDSSGNAYLAVQSYGATFPTTAGAFQTTSAGGVDIAVVKLNATGSALAYSTYIGGSGNDFCTAIAVDGANNAYVLGGTPSSDFPTTPGAFQTTLAGGGDAFVTKLNSAGSALVYSTLLGGSSGGDGGDGGIAVDSAGNAYVSGGTDSLDFPVTAGAFQTGYAGGRDMFVAKLNSSGSALVYCTYLGGSGFENPTQRGLTLDSIGNAYVTGLTQSTDFPTTAGAFQTTLAGGRDTFVTKLNPLGSALVYSTYLGGGGNDANSYGGIAVDSAGNAYVTGTTSSINFPVTAGAFQTNNAGGEDAFVTKFNATGSGLLYSTYLGGNSQDGAPGIAIDSHGNAWVAGDTFSTNLPTTPDAFQTSLAGGRDAFVLLLNASGSALVYSTYLGGSGSDENPFGIAIDATGNVYVIGQTNSSDFPTTAGAFQTTFAGGGGDAFVTKIAAHQYSAQVQPPINADGTSVFSAKRGLVPVKFTLADFGTATCSLPPAAIAVTRTAGATTGTVNESDYMGPSDSGSNFKALGCQFEYNLSSSALGSGTYRVDITIDNQVVGNAVFQLK